LFRSRKGFAAVDAAAAVCPCTPGTAKHAAPKSKTGLDSHAREAATEILSSVNPSSIPPSRVTQYAFHDKPLARSSIHVAWGLLNYFFTLGSDPPPVGTAAAAFFSQASWVMTHRKPRCCKPVSGGQAMRALGR
jgi:hypothetical protein